MKKTEKVIGVIAILSLVMQVLLLPGAGPLTVLSLSTLSIMYFFFGVLLFNDIRLRSAFRKSSYVGVSKYRKVGAIASGVALSITAIGLMFKIQVWPGANVMIMDGLKVLGIVTFVAFIKYSQNRLAYYVGIFKRAAIFGGVALIFIALPSSSWIEYKYRNHPAYRDALINACSQPRNQALWDKAQEEREKMDNEPN